MGAISPFGLANGANVAERSQPIAHLDAHSSDRVRNGRRADGERADVQWRWRVTRLTTSREALAVSELRFVRRGFGAEAVEYQVAWDEQRRVHAARFADEIPDTVLLLEHPPVYTAGRRTADSERPLDGTPVVDVDRGGKITWHGPGQLVGYPIQKLPRPVDVVAHVRRLEEALIRTCAEFGLETTRVEGRSGVWVLGDPVERRPVLGGLSLDFDPRLTDEEFDPRLNGPEYAPSNAGQRREDRKIAAIGIRVAKGVTMHGFALNVNPDNKWFDRIIPCGIRDAGVASLANELGRDVTIAEVLPVVERHLTEVMAAAELRPRVIEPKAVEKVTEKTPAA
ncbi:lipoyl(octanoyl) transferase LipB [Streptomyces sp. CAI-85]|uniref:lipoyl(octanoyl) transferase LipB n=1 Tax=Streptomyces sp. CAI-85 TaxID=1472662 RepID=UPI0026DB037B|nr:lipoyl(octanoyl) transferase LipB [Streptomyces sp. CAI-85]